MNSFKQFVNEAPEPTLEQVTQDAFGVFSRMGSTADKPLRNNKGMSFGVRDIGQWENPPDARDEEDYDWKQPTPATMKMVKEKLDVLRKAYPKFQLVVGVGEKNWLEFHVEKK